jgi:archaellum biogenesis protein FlaJ (TadC family)
MDAVEVPPNVELMASLRLLFSTAFGAFVLYILNRHQNRQPFSLFVALNVDVGQKASAWLVLLDMIVSSVIGAGVVYLLTQPVTVPQAVVAGLGMTGILSSHAKDTGGK